MCTLSIYMICTTVLCTLPVLCNDVPTFGKCDGIPTTSVQNYRDNTHTRTRDDGAGMLTSTACPPPIPAAGCTDTGGRVLCWSFLAPRVVPLLLLLPEPPTLEPGSVPRDALAPSVVCPMRANADKGSKSTTTPPSPFLPPPPPPTGPSLLRCSAMFLAGKPSSTALLLL